VLDQLPDLSDRLRDADDATKRALFDALDLRVVFDKARDRLSISATLTETAAMLHDGIEPLRLCALRGTDSRTHTTLRQDCRLPPVLNQSGRTVRPA
jgi:hypothetical protein